MQNPHGVMREINSVIGGVRVKNNKGAVAAPKNKTAMKLRGNPLQGLGGAQASLAFKP